MKNCSCLSMFVAATMCLANRVRVARRRRRRRNGWRRGDDRRRGTSGSGGVAGTGAGGSHDAGAGGSAPADAGSSVGGQPGTGGRAGGTGGSPASDAGAGGAPGDAGSGAFDPCPTNGMPCKILPLGDSITFGIQYEGAYRVELFTKAVAANKKITFVGSQMNGPTTVAGMTFPRSHEGHSGFTIDQMMPFVASDAQYAPNIILLHIGTNDTYMANPGGAPRGCRAWST